MFFLSRKITILLAFIFIGGLSVFALRFYVVEKSQDYIFSTISQIPAKKVGIVLGARVFPNGRVSEVLEDRLQAAKTLYDVKKFQIFLLSGDNSTTHYNEVEAMSGFLVKQGVPTHDIVLDYAGFDTYDTMYRARDIFGAKDAIIFTQDFHLNRSVYIARSLGLDAVGHPTDLHAYVGMDYMQFRELFASMKAVWDVDIADSLPKFLGKKEITPIISMD